MYTCIYICIYNILYPGVVCLEVPFDKQNADQPLSTEESPLQGIVYIRKTKIETLQGVYVFMASHGSKGFGPRSKSQGGGGGNDFVCTVEGKKWAVASVAHSGCETLFCANLVAHRMYGLARSGDLKIAGFPRFEEAISGLKGMQSMQAPSYEVCVTLSDGTLIIKQLVLDMWTQKHPDFSAECTELLTAHNSEFNPKNIQSGGEVQEGTTTVELPSKQLCVQGTKSKSDFEKEHADRFKCRPKMPKRPSRKSN